MQAERSRLAILNTAFLLGFGLVALIVMFWGVVRSARLGEREDNPRVVEAALRIRRGAIHDTYGEILAESVGDPYAERFYQPESGPAVGYYSFQYGTVGIEDSLNAHLSGESGKPWTQAWRDLTHQPATGLGVRLSIDSRWQAAATESMGDHQGAAVLLSIPDYAVRAMVSHPSYDPNDLDSNFEALVADQSAPLLNRVTQGQYQPGTVLEPFLLAYAIDQGIIDLTDRVTNGRGRVFIDDNNSLTCARAGNARTWGDVLQAGCPAPLQKLQPSIDTVTLTQFYTEYGLTSDIDLLNTADQSAVAADIEPETAVIDDVALALIGQDNLTVTPLQIARAWSGLVSDRTLHPIELVSALQDSQGVWRILFPDEPEVEPPPFTAVTTANQIIGTLPTHGTIVEYSALALAGPEGGTNGWYLGMAPAGRPNFVLVLVIENESAETVTEIGREIMTSVLAPKSE